MGLALPSSLSPAPCDPAEGEVTGLLPLPQPSSLLQLSIFPLTPSLLPLWHKSHGDSPIQPLGKGL